MDQFHKKQLSRFFLASSSLIALIALSFLFSPTARLAEDPLSYGMEVQSAGEVQSACESTLGSAYATPCVPAGTAVDCGAKMDAIAKAENYCNAIGEEWNMQTVAQTAIKKQAREEAWDQIKDKAKEVLAQSFRNSLSSLSRQIAHDTAVWVASGGKGQKPLFITEGWGAYLKNAADSALGDFIDNIGQSYGVDLCKPDISIRIAIETGINWQKPRQVRCTFSQMMNNWETAVSNPNFSFEYTNSMRPGENDVSVFLTLQSRAFQTVSEEVNIKEKEGDTASLFNDVKSFAGKILTPGTAVKDAFLAAVNPAGDNASFGYDTFTGTIADIIEEFLNTLVSQLLKNLQSGLFSSSSGDDSSQPFQLPDLSALFNPNASPRTYEGASGAAERFNNLIPLTTRVGGPYDILTKLMLCTEQSKSNLGPTDCVLDPILAEAIRQKTQVKDLPAEVLGRVFAPSIDEVTNPQIAFTERNIKILRKYRIVPVGWEVAAEKIRQSGQKKTYTLGDVIDSAEFKDYIDPYWVLEVPELFCRQLGYGEHNSSAKSQDGSITRDEYCADEQQCIQQNENGNCSAYGYCTEERRFWNFGGKTCQPKYNTCETFAGRDGLKDSWLVNSLNFAGCDQNNYGCRWLSAAYNTVGNVWTHLEPERVMTPCTVTAGCELSVPTLARIKQGRIMTDDRKIIMSQPCSAAACSSENLIRNGGFESPLSDSGSEWEYFYDGWSGGNEWANMSGTVFNNGASTSNYYSRISNDPGYTKPRSGSQMLTLFNPTEPYISGSRYFQHKTIKLKAGKKYILSVYVHQKDGTAATIYADFGSAVSATNTKYYNFSLANTWQRLTSEVTPIQDVDVTPRLAVIGAYNSHISFDDVQLQESSASKCIYSEESKTCSFYQGSCTIPNGGVMCSVDNCQVGNNLLAGLNSGFETAVANMDYRADKWNFEDSYYNLENRLFREARVGGGYQLSIRANDNPSELSVKLDNIVLLPQQRYALSFRLRGDYINQGGLSVGLFERANGELIRGLSFTTLPQFWQNYQFEFDVPAAASSTYLKIVLPERTRGLLAADDFELKLVDKNCNANSIWLTQGLSNSTAKDVYFNAQMAACDGSAEGCSQFIRTKEGLGSNLIVNGSFNEATSGWEFLGNHFNYVNNNNSDYAKITTNTATYGTYKIVDILPGTYYMISYEAAQIDPASGDKARFEMYLAANRTGVPVPGVRVVTTDCSQTGDNTITLQNAPAGVAWERKYCKFLAPQGAYVLRYKIFANDEEIYVDNLKLEPVYYNVDTPSAYTDYNPNARPANQVAYLKKAQDIFSCYRTSDGKWATASTLLGILAGRQLACKSYAPVCTQNEVGCELYTPVNGDPAVPGIVDNLNVCPAQCAGYSVYRQEETDFVSSKYRQFIADKNLKYCSAAYAGCDEFTNLDKLGEGAEAREYYVNFRVCQKPGAADEGSYYTWEGSDTLGYQLKVYRLKESNQNNGNAPCTYITYSNGIAQCADGNISNQGVCTREQMFVNPDCREFYNSGNGEVSYRLLSKTISISDDCHPYRRTQTQTAFGEAEDDCEAKQGFWKDNACVYMAIPGEGRTCPSSVMGCREFTGNRANNVRNLINSNFGTDSVSTSSWQDSSGGTSGLQISTESSFVGGYSINNATGNLIIKHPVSVVQGRAYTLSFWAKSGITSGFTMGDIEFSTSPTGKSYTFTLTSSTDGDLANAAPIITTNWKKYDLGPVFVTWEPGADEYLVFNIPGGKKIYLDNVILKEVREDIFAIDNSWYTPLACDNKLGDDTGQKAIDSGACTPAVNSVQGTRCSPGEMVGCAAYTDRAGTLNYFRSFARLCRQEAAGCEALIDTYNYTPATGTVANAGDKSQITVKADETIYLVNDRQYTCRDSEKGCTAYGLPLITKFDEVAGYNTAYLLNNPDLYNRTLCKFNEVWCDQYVGSASVRYFKNPHGRVCVFEAKAGQLEGDWYIAGTDEACITTADQTLGSGYGNLSDKYQPIGSVDNVTGTTTAAYSGWVGACPESQSGCSEVIDPLPYIYTSLRLESGASTTIKINTLYVVVNGSVEAFDSRSGKASLVYPDQSQNNAIKRFYISCPKGLAKCQDENISIKVTASARLSKAGVYYVFDNALDRSSCNGQVDYDSGCVLVNDRAGMDYASSTPWAERVTKYLSYDSYATYRKNRNITYGPAGEEIVGKITPTAPLSGENDANLVIKVKPDRTCNSWLTCTTYEKKDDSASASFSNNDKCLAVGLCDSLNEQGVCDHFISNTPATGYDPKRDANKSGYTYLSAITGGYYSYELMTQEAESANVSNGNFELIFGGSSVSGIRQVGEAAKKETYFQPMGWSAASYNCPNSTCSGGDPRASYDNLTGKEMYLNINIQAAKEGRNSLQINAGNSAMSEFVELDANTHYIFSAWVNTANLQGSSTVARAEIQLRFYNGSGVIVTTSALTVEGNAVTTFSSCRDSNNNTLPCTLATEGGWYYDGTSNHLRLPVGLPWRQMMLDFRTGSNINRMSIALMNMNPRDGGGYDNSKLGGYSLWDDISLKPMLKVNDTKLVNRTCRVYPGQSAPACRYTIGSNSYYGMYGYCLLDDPANPGQCLQWWPIDSIKGEVMDDFSTYYQERAPLYYCISKLRRTYAFFGGSIATNASGELPEEYQGVLRDTGGIKATPFTVNASARPLFRYPFIYRFSPTVIAVGVGLDKGVYGMVFTAQMYPKRVCATIPILNVSLLCYSATKEKAEDMEPLTTDEVHDPGPAADCGGGTFIGNFLCQVGSFFIGLAEDVMNAVAKVVRALITLVTEFKDMLIQKLVLTEDDFWGGFGILAIGGPIGGGSGGVLIPIPMPWHEAYNMKDGGGALFNALGEAISKAIGGGIIGVRIVTDNYRKDGGELVDPVPSVPGDILGYASFMTSGQIFGAGTLITFGNNYVVEYCNKVVQVVNSSGQNKAWATRLTPGSSYQSTRSDCVGDSLVSSEDTRKCFYLSDYCLFRDCILNPSKICDFCENLVGRFDVAGGKIMTVTKKVEDSEDVTNVACPEHTGTISRGARFASDAEIYDGKMVYRVLRGGNECKDLFIIDYNKDGVRDHVYRRIYSNNYFDYGVDYQPFGSVVAPSDAQYPQQWDSRPEVLGKQPLFYELPNTGLNPPYQARMGQWHDADSAKQLFAQSYGVWNYDWNSRSYVQAVNEGWGLPGLCANNKRPVAVATSFCRVRPVIKNFRVQPLNNSNSSSSPLVVKISFNIQVDSEQVPIRSYSVDWGDGTQPTSYSGVSLLPRPASSTAENSSFFTLYHYYDRRQMSTTSVDVAIRTKDNWSAIGGAKFRFNLNSLPDAGLTSNAFCSCIGTGANYCPDPFCQILSGGGTNITDDPDEGTFGDDTTYLSYGDVITLKSLGENTPRWVYYGHRDGESDAEPPDGDGIAINHVRIAETGGSGFEYGGQIPLLWKQFKVCNSSGDCSAAGPVSAESIITLRTEHGAQFLRAKASGGHRYIDEASGINDNNRFKIAKLNGGTMEIQPGDRIRLEIKGVSGAAKTWFVYHFTDSVGRETTQTEIRNGSSVSDAHYIFQIQNSAGF